MALGVKIDIEKLKTMPIPNEISILIDRIAVHYGTWMRNAKSFTAREDFTPCSNNIIANSYGMRGTYCENRVPVFALRKVELDDLMKSQDDPHQACIVFHSFISSATVEALADTLGGVVIDADPKVTRVPGVV